MFERSTIVWALGTAAVVLACVGGLPAAAPNGAAPRHPGLLASADELDRLRLKLKTEPWRAGLFEQAKKDADEGNLVAAAVVSALAHDEAYGAKVRAHLLRQAQQFVAGRPGAQYPWGPEAGDAIAFDLVAPRMGPDEQQAVAGYLRQLARDGIAYHKKQPLTPNMSFVCHWRIGLIGYAIADREIIAWAIDDPGPPWGGRRPGRWGGFKPAIEHTLTDGAFWDEATIYGNFSILGMMYLAEAARHFDGTDLYNYTSPNGGSLRKAVAGLVSLAYPIERTGVGKGSVRMATWGDGSTAPPNRINNESGDAYFVNKPHTHPERQNLYPVVEMAYHAWKDPAHAYLLSLNPRRDERLGWFEYLPVSLLLGETLPPQTPPPPMASALYPQTGIAVLRSDESSGYWTSGGLVAVQQMGRNYGHDHRDKFQLMHWGRGRLHYPDWNAQQYEPMEYGWTRNGWAHSTLIVDEANPQGGGSTERHDFNRDVKFLATTSREIYRDVTQTRALLLTHDYLLDCFWADSPRERTYDWFVHAIGKLSLPLEHAFRPSQDLSKPYRWIDRERKRETDRTWCADFVQQSGGVLRGMGQFTDQWHGARVGVRMTMLGEPGTAAYAGEGPFNPVPNLREYGNPEGTIPLAVARRKARTTCFTALHEPYDDKPSLSIRRVAHEAAAVAVCVSGPRFSDYACVSFSDRPADGPCRLVDAADPSQVFSFRDYAYLRVERGKVLARGGWDSFCVAAPGAASAGAVLVNGKEAPYKTQGGYILFNVPADAALGVGRTPRVPTQAAGEAPDAPAGEAPAPPAVALAFSPERVSIAKNREIEVSLVATNNTAQAREAIAALALPEGVVAEPRQVRFPVMEPGRQAAAVVRLKGGGRDTSGEIVAGAPGCEARLPFSVGVTIREAQRHPLFPMWVVQAPGYEIHIHRKFGVSRTLIGKDGYLWYGSEWWGGSGVFEVRLPTGAEETAPIAWGRNAKELRWRGATLEAAAQSGESFTATFGEHAIGYRFRGKPGVTYRASIQSFFRHPTARVRTAKDAAAAGLPPTLGGLSWASIQNPGLSPECVFLLTPRQPAEWGFRPVVASPFWPLCDGDRFILLFGAEKEIRGLAEAAVKE